MNEYKFENISIGLEESFTAVVTEGMMSDFLKLTGDINPLHNDEDFAKEKGFASRVVYGLLTSSLLSTLAGVYLPGRNSLIYGVDIEFPKPVYVGDELLVSGVVSEKDERFRYYTVKVCIRNQNGQKVCRGKMKLGVLE